MQSSGLSPRKKERLLRLNCFTLSSVIAFNILFDFCSFVESWMGFYLYQQNTHVRMSGQILLIVLTFSKRNLYIYHFRCQCIFPISLSNNWLFQVELKSCFTLFLERFSNPFLQICPFLFCKWSDLLYFSDHPLGDDWSLIYRRIL